MSNQDITIQFIPNPTDPRFQDLTAQKFGRLTVVGFGGIINKRTHWICVCDCGNIATVKAGHLKGNKTRSCGCLQYETRFCSKYGTKEANSAEYYAFYHARGRCQNTQNANFKTYGGRGIEFRFTSFQEFLKEVGRRPTPQHSLDRIDVNGHYEKGNVRWATSKEQQNNRRNNKTIVINGVQKPLVEWANENSILPATVYRRLSQGWCQRCAIKLTNYQKCIHKSSDRA